MRLGSLRERLPEPVRIVMERLRENRAGGLAAAAAFYGLLSIPPLLVGLIATAALVAMALGPEVVDSLSSQILSVAGHALSPEAVADVLKPSLDKLLREPSPGVLSVGYLLALWSASRMINALMQGIDLLTTGERSPLSTRLLAIKTLAIGLFAIAIFLPILAIGPAQLLGFLGANVVVTVLGWLAAAVVGVVVLAFFFRSAMPAKPSWRHAFVGGALALTGWALGSWGLQAWTARATSGPSIYGPLSAPIALLLWLQLIAWVALATSVVIDLLRGNDQVRPAR